jgi:trk system potassium uptake protein TrkA
MRIVILGAGQVGASVAEALASEANDITIVDQSREAIGDIADRLDVRTLVGNGALPSVLKNAGLDEADMLVAVTQSDAINLVACKIARRVFNVTTRVARLRSSDYLDDRTLLDDDHFAVSHAICPEQEITDYIVRLIEFPEALQVLEFADGRVTLVCVRAYDGGLLVGKPIKTMREHLPSSVDARIAAIFREHQPVEPEGNTVIEGGDEVFVLAATEYIRPLMRELRRMLKPVKRVMIAGGGNIGARVALALEADHEVKVIERDLARAEHVAARLQRSAGAARRGHRRERPGAGEHRRDGHVPRPDQRRRGQHHGRLAGQAPRLQARAGADQPPALTPTWCRAGRSTSACRRRRSPSVRC